MQKNLFIKMQLVLILILFGLTHGFRRSTHTNIHGIIKRLRLSKSVLDDIPSPSNAPISPPAPLKYDVSARVKKKPNKVLKAKSKKRFKVKKKNVPEVVAPKQQTSASSVVPTKKYGFSARVVKRPVISTPTSSKPKTSSLSETVSKAPVEIEALSPLEVEAQRISSVNMVSSLYSSSPSMEIETDAIKSDTQRNYGFSARVVKRPVISTPTNSKPKTISEPISQQNDRVKPSMQEVKNKKTTSEEKKQLTLYSSMNDKSVVEVMRVLETLSNEDLTAFAGEATKLTFVSLTSATLRYEF